MSDHKYEVGQSLDFRSATKGPTAASGQYLIVARRPAADGEPMYLIKSELERHQRIASESELRWTR